MNERIKINNNVQEKTIRFGDCLQGICGGNF